LTLWILILLPLAFPSPVSSTALRRRGAGATGVRLARPVAELQ
jgi:hypothetical protein